MKGRKLTVQLLVCLLAIFSYASQGETQALRKVHVGIPTISISSGSFIVAKERRYYRDEGLDVELIVMRGAPAIQALIGGNVPFASSGGAGLLPIVRGAPLRIVFTTFYRPMFWLYSRSDIRSIAELKGKKVGVSSIGSGPDTLLRAVLRKHGLEGGRDVVILPTGPGTARFFALKAGATEAAVLNEQAAFMAQDSGFRELFSFIKEKDLVEVQGSIVLRDSLLESDPALVEKFVRATLKGALYLRENRPGSIVIHTRALKTDEKMAARIYDAARPGITADGSVNEELQKKAIEHIVERAELKEPPQLGKIFDFSIARKVYAELQAKGWKPSE